MQHDFSDTRLIITGASSGIGLATARLFADNGASVVNVSRRPCPDDRIHSIALDLLDPAQVQSLPARLVDVSTRARTVLIHNAASLVNDTLQSADPKQFARVLELNVEVPMRLSQALLPQLGVGSAVLFVGSTLSEKAVANSLSYSTSKHALIGLMRAAAQDLAGTGIHTVAVCPGFTDTEMVRSHVPDPEVLQAIGGNNAFGRLIEPAEIARTLAFCAASPVLHGAVIHANLGQIEH